MSEEEEMTYVKEEINILLLKPRQNNFFIKKKKEREVYGYIFSDELNKCLHFYSLHELGVFRKSCFYKYHYI